MRGRFVAVVGPSGVWKDSLIAGMIARDPSLARMLRVVTRPPSPPAATRGSSRCTGGHMAWAMPFPRPSSMIFETVRN